MPQTGKVWVGPSNLAGGISWGGEGFIGWWMAGLWAIFWRQVDWVLFSDPQTHIEGVKNAISGTVAVIHWLTRLWFECSVVALGLRLQTIWKLALNVHPGLAFKLPASLHLWTQWQGVLPMPTPCWVGPSHIAGSISQGGEGLMGKHTLRVSKKKTWFLALLLWFIDYLTCDLRAQWLPWDWVPLLFESCHPEVSHYQSSPLNTVARCAAKSKPPCRGHISGRGGAHRMVDGGFVSYLLASSGLGFVFRPSNTHWGGQKRYFWH